MKKEIILDFLNEYIPFLENIYNTDEKHRWCASYNVYQPVLDDHWNLSASLTKYVKKAYDIGLIPNNYSATYDTIGNEELYTNITTPCILTSLSNIQLISVIAKEFRHDHFVKVV